MTDRPVAGVVIPEGYDDAEEFAQDNGLELIGRCLEDEFKRRVMSKPFMPTADEAYRWMKSNPLTSADMLKEIAREAKREGDEGAGARETLRTIGGMED